MSRVHVFAIDWVPERADVASGGGLRSLQIIAALRDGGHDVTVSVPRGTRFVQQLETLQPARARALLLHDKTNQADILRETRPQAVVWLWPSERNVVFGDTSDLVHVCDLNGLQDFEFAGGSTGALEPARKRLRESCRRADLMLAGSDAQYGYWLAELGRDGPLGAAAGAPRPLIVVPYALPHAMRSPGATTASRLRRLHFIGNLFSWNASAAHLLRVAAWVANRADIRLSLICGIDVAFGTALPDIEMLRRLDGMRNVEITETIGFGEAMDRYGDGSLHLDLYDASIERLLAVPIRTVNALAHGVPTLATVGSALAERIARAGAGVVMREAAGSEAVEAALGRIADMPADAFTAMSTASRKLDADAFSPEAAGMALCVGIAEAIDRRSRRVQGWRSHQREPVQSEPMLGNVLVFSNEDGNLRELRVGLPFAAMQRQRMIASYSIWSRGRLIQTGRGVGASPSFDVLWVQRSASAELALLLDALGLPFVYDIDDHLLISPAYRPAFAPETVQAVRGFIRMAGVLSCSTGRLARHLQSHASTPLLHKTVVTPNLLRAPPPPRMAGEPSCVIWSSSDTPALTESRRAVLRAVRDFCLTHALRLVCVGAPPPDMILGGDVPVEHMPSIGYASYLDLLRATAPAILVCPLETAGDPATQEFVDGKSDIKILEALGTGLVGVFSAARPYLDSQLPGAIYARNDYRSWFAALRTARETCLRGTQVSEVFPPERLASGIGLMPWFEALHQARLPVPVSMGEISDTLAMIHTRIGRHRLSPDEFDAEFYLGRHADIRAALEQGKIASAYEHYLTIGYAEGRAGRLADEAVANGEQLWANLFHTVNDARNAIENRALVIEDLKRRRDMRLQLRRAAL